MSAWTRITFLIKKELKNNNNSVYNNKYNTGCFGVYDVIIALREWAKRGRQEQACGDSAVREAALL